MSAAPSVGEVQQSTPSEEVWNFPLVLLAVKVGSALAAGCTVVIKPAEQTPLTALHFASICASAGIPSGVVNVVTGLGATAGAALANHMDVDKISFTGSTDVGRLIMKASADSNLKKVTLELGGKSPCIVFSDANVDHAVKMAHFALFFNSGQACSAASRCFVQEDIYDEFVAKAAQRANEKIVGDPFNPKTENGPQIDAIQHKKILELIESGKGEGARLVAGGGSKEGKGFFIEPTVFADVTDHMRIAREEIFGPVQQIMKFRSVEEVIQRANDSNFALAASVFTKDINKALTIANSIKSGIVWINCHHVFRTQAPFGGCKESGMGREYAEEGIREYCEIKTVTVKIPQKNS
uniref:aldehyde dehydrogenase (NAD(+)) n=1 Tax=Plectus sambesii TaxID=2011161 RepID=A0A914VF63_9BILA